ncbi:unnamed protein product [Urochloa decumbens]|uniref:F-box domain-containing protein n=1 Tax=Urochloa decumbens TaxID=240449 RepID=A0ABC9BV27_9POAL
MPRHRGGRPRPAPPVALPDDDDILSEILLRLPPQPSSLPRASLVCKRWRRLVTDPHFRRRFRVRHRKPPLIGVFEDHMGHPFFRSVMDPPDLIPAERFRPPLGDGKGLNDWRIFGCRHGCLLLMNRTVKEIVLWDPLTGDRRVVAVPTELDNQDRIVWNGAVLCAAAGDPSHVHFGLSSCPFKVALVGVTSNHTQVFVCSYSSETGNWSDLASATVPFTVYCVTDPGTLVGNTLYWMPVGLGYGILEFNLDRHSLHVIEWPSSVTVSGRCTRHIMLAQNGGLGLAILSCDDLKMWERKVSSEGVAEWVLQKTHSLSKIHGMESGTEGVCVLGYAEDTNVMLLWTVFGVYMLQLDSLESRKLWETNFLCPHHPYTSIYDSVAGIQG